jgi:short subunit dehydrogenase-like uncharacterized protein
MGMVLRCFMCDLKVDRGFNSRMTTLRHEQRPPMPDLIIYGANGYTGELIVRRAVEQGLRPLIAGRNAAQLEAIAKRSDLPFKACELSDAIGLDILLQGVKVLIHAAGPFIHTSRPMLEACIRNGVHYLDITGEIEVFRMAHGYHEQAKEKGVMLLPGTGFDVVPSDCLAAHLHARMPDATDLVLAFHSSGRSSRGTTLTAIEGLGKGGAIREQGKLKAVQDAFDSRPFQFGDQQHMAVTIPWGDVYTAFISTGIPNIRVYMSMPQKMIRALRIGRWLGWFTGSAWFKDRLRRKVKAGKAGPSDSARAKGSVQLVGTVSNAQGAKITATIRTPDGYTLTAMTAIYIASEVLKGNFKPGFQTPSLLFGEALITRFTDAGFVDLK